VEVAGDLKATRSNILDLGALGAYRPGQQVYPVEVLHQRRELGDSVPTLTGLINRAFDGHLKPNVFKKVDVDAVKAMI
jgi:hypothetical protein